MSEASARLRRAAIQCICVAGVAGLAAQLSSPIGPSSPLAQPCRIEHNTELVGSAVKRHALRLLGWAELPIASCARTCTRRHTDCAAPRNC
eukprot:861788-Prymnesium_polylepis.1